MMRIHIAFSISFDSKKVDHRIDRDLTNGSLQWSLNYI